MISMPSSPDTTPGAAVSSRRKANHSSPSRFDRGIGTGGSGRVLVPDPSKEADNRREGSPTGWRILSPSRDIGITCDVGILASILLHSGKVVALMAIGEDVSGTL